MDTFVLLPFFLLSHVTTDVDIYHGPMSVEYTYDVYVNVAQDDSPFVFYVNSTLMCRPHEFDTLNCYFGDVSAAMYEDRIPPNINKGKDTWQLSEPFQIKFDRRGIRGLVVNRKTNRRDIDMMRAIVSQLNFGVNLLFKSDGMYSDIESSYIGECQSYVNISREYNGASSNENFEIVPLPGLKKTHGEVVTIEKTRNMENCIHKEDYVFTSDERGQGLLQMKIISSYSRIIISDTNYQSHTDNTVEIKVKERTNRLSETITLSLISMLPAEEALEPVPNPTITSLYVYVELE